MRDPDGHRPPAPTPGATPGATADPACGPPSPAATDVLASECDTFGRYLVRVAPGAYVVAKYRAGHAAANIAPTPAAGSFDALVIRIARLGAFPARLADTYTRILARHSLLRRKLTLLVAVLESVAPSHRAFEPAPPSSPAASLLRMAGHGIGFLGLLTLALALFLPLHALTCLMPWARARLLASRGAPPAVLRVRHAAADLTRDP
jgi:hypothetical protein